ncbi:hypothetical protein WN51_14035 [Melipona quadrifasciata]|uniref:Uncharacterized protein n=2 Tax=Apocrita TaxID=7400 RepID=A0A0M8ZZ97_9HYME|nr:hypothetical protein WN51_14035 [Melipona quadrifasciata]
MSTTECQKYGRMTNVICCNANHGPPNNIPFHFVFTSYTDGKSPFVRTTTFSKDRLTGHGGISSLGGGNSSPYSGAHHHGHRGNGNGSGMPHHGGASLPTASDFQPPYFPPPFPSHHHAPASPQHPGLGQPQHLDYLVGDPYTQTLNTLHQHHYNHLSAAVTAGQRSGDLRRDAEGIHVFKIDWDLNFHASSNLKNENLLKLTLYRRFDIKSANNCHKQTIWYFPAGIEWNTVEHEATSVQNAAIDHHRGSSSCFANQDSLRFTLINELGNVGPVKRKRGYKSINLLTEEYLPGMLRWRFLYNEVYDEKASYDSDWNFNIQFLLNIARTCIAFVKTSWKNECEGPVNIFFSNWPKYTNMHASFPYDGGVEYGAVRRPDALLPPPGLDQTDLVLHSSLVDDPQNTNVDDGGFMNDLPLLKIQVYNRYQIKIVTLLKNSIKIECPLKALTASTRQHLWKLIKFGLSLDEENLWKFIKTHDHQSIVQSSHFTLRTLDDKTQYVVATLDAILDSSERKGHNGGKGVTGSRFSTVPRSMVFGQLTLVVTEPLAEPATLRTALLKLPNEVLAGCCQALWTVLESENYMRAFPRPVPLDLWPELPIALEPSDLRYTDITLLQSFVIKRISILISLVCKRVFRYIIFMQDIEEHSKGLCHLQWKNKYLIDIDNFANEISVGINRNCNTMFDVKYLLILVKFDRIAEGLNFKFEVKFHRIAPFFFIYCNSYHGSILEDKETQQLHLCFINFDKHFGDHGFVKHQSELYRPIFFSGRLMIPT